MVVRSVETREESVPLGFEVQSFIGLSSAFDAGDVL